MNDATPASPGDARIIMILGIQRSGTSALFNALAADPEVRPYNEARHDEIYEDYLLRPEREIRRVIRSSSRPLLLRPVQESARRDLRLVMEEFGRYDVRAVWLTRDPVAVLSSAVDAGWWEPTVRRVVREALDWRLRTRRGLALLAADPRRTTIVSYEDLSKDPNLVEALARRLSLVARPVFGDDRHGGGRLGRPLSVLIKVVTWSTMRRVRAAVALAALGSPASGRLRSEPSTDTVSPSDLARLPGGLRAQLPADPVPCLLGPDHALYTRLADGSEFSLLTLVRTPEPTGARSGGPGNFGAIVTVGRPFSGAGGFSLGWLHHSVEARYENSERTSAVVAGLASTTGRAASSRAEHHHSILMSAQPGERTLGVAVTHRLVDGRSLLELVVVDGRVARIGRSTSQHPAATEPPFEIHLYGHPDRPDDAFTGRILELRLLSGWQPAPDMAAALLLALENVQTPPPS